MRPDRPARRCGKMTRVSTPGKSASTRAEAGFVPIPVAELELAAGAPVPAPNALGQILLLVRVHGVPVGSLSLLEEGAASPQTLRALARAHLEQEVAQHLERDGLDVVPGAEEVPVPEVCRWLQPAGARSVSVVVCTLGEDPRLVRTARSILDSDHEDLELVVVDNQPGTGRVSALLAELTDPRLRIVPQPRRGLSAARNQGLGAARGSVVAFTDDDAFVDQGWLRNLVRPFDEHPDVVCVTGLVLPAEIATPAQAWFEEFGAFDKGFERTVWHTGERSDLGGLGRRGHGGPLFPYSAGVFGSGNNMAFRRDWLVAQRLFDESLGAGTIARGGEDLDAFLTVMLDGAVLVYEPRAVVRHHARGDMHALHRQMYGYGSGMAAVVVKQFLSGPRSAARVATLVPGGLRKLLDPQSEKNASRSAEYPAGLARSELAGYVAGPALYLRSRWEAARRLRRFPPTRVP